jgi:F0F1-type ATP synthase assembly protein I
MKANGAGKEKEKQQRPIWPLALNLGWQIAIPIVAFGLTGRLADKTFNTHPWFFLTGVVISIPLAIYLIYREINNFFNNCS